MEVERSEATFFECFANEDVRNDGVRNDEVRNDEVTDNSLAQSDIQKISLTSFLTTRVFELSSESTVASGVTWRARGR